MALLTLRNLRTSFFTEEGEVRAVDGVSYSIESGKTLGVVGESGSGKSVSAMSILQLLGGNGKIVDGSVTFLDRDITHAGKKELRKLRGNQISVIFQEPMTSLNPVFTIKRQVAEPFTIHRRLRKKDAEGKVLDLLRLVQIPNPERVAKEYPHQLSGGMRQRIMIAMALACQPKLLIADEPTTALDVTIQAQILRLMNELKSSMSMSILFISHDLFVIREMADDIVVMYCGQVVEQAKTETIFSEGTLLHPYTEGLMKSVPSLTTKRGGRLPVIPGSVPHPNERISGCRFHPRCPYATERCGEEEPGFYEVSEGHFIRCYRAEKEED